MKTVKPNLEKMFNEAAEKYRGKRVMLRVFGDGVLTELTTMQIPAVVKDIRVAYGRINLLVEPVRGKGQSWVRIDRVRVVKQWDVDHELEHAAPATKDSLDRDLETASVKQTKRPRR